MKQFLAVIALFALLVCALAGCAAGEPPAVQTYREDGLPSWVGEPFTDPRGLWAGYNDEKGLYASGSALYGDRGASTTAAELDAKTHLVELVQSGGKPVRSLVGVRRVDRFVAEDGTVYVLMFISNKNAKKSTK